MNVSPKLRSASRGKEAALFFLAFFYFLVATNTQSGWLFLLSAFLLGLLLMSWLPPRRAARQADLQREMLGSPQRGVPLRVRLRLTNQGTRPLREVLVVDPANPWSKEGEPFRWVVPTLPPGQSVSAEYTLTPGCRGEHRLAGSVLSFGAPFGLFKVSATLPDSDPFLIFPRLVTLSARRQRTRLAGILTDFTSPRSKGDSLSLRSLREYRAGDDLRQVHWKSSAKSSQGVLLVREHHAPSRQLSLLVLDTSARPSDQVSEEQFENSVTLAASLLWSAHRAGTRSTLLVRDEQGWQRWTRWEEQYSGLARLSRLEDVEFADWAATAGHVTSEFPETRLGSHPVLLTSAASPEQLGPSADWPLPGSSCVLSAPMEKAHLFSDYPVAVMNLEEGQGGEVLSHV